MKLVFHRSLYDVDAVHVAARAWGSLAKTDIAVGENDIVVDLEPEGGDLPEDAADAFANHVLFETIVRVRRGVA
jgi:hypothetical protein